MNDPFARIKARFEDEQRAAAVPRSLADIPMSYEAFTPEWLTAVLRPHHPGLEVAACALDRVDEGTSNRRRVFLRYADPGAAAAAGWPPSVFCKATQRLENRYMLALNGGIAAEVNFYRRVRPTLGIEAPQSYHAIYDPESFNSIIVMRDLAGKVEFCQLHTPMTLERGMSQMRLLARLHGRYYASPELDSTLGVFNTWEEFFTVTVEQAGFGEACARGFSDAREVIPPALYARQAAIWPATLACVARHRELPRTLVHSDVHLKNWYLAPGEVMGVNDWQCTCKGNWGRDVSYAISTAYQPEDRRRFERDLLRFYLEALAGEGAPAPSFDEAWRIYRQQIFAALAWWTGTLGQPPEAPRMQPAAVSLEFIRRMTHAIDDLDALGSF